MKFSVQILAIMLLYPVLPGCQQGPAITEVQNDYQTVAASLKDPFGISTNASNIVFKSLDEGQSWVDISAGLPEDLGVNRVVANAGKVILVTENRLFLLNTNNAAAGWENEATQNIKFHDVYLGITGNYATNYGKGFFKEIPGSGVWLPMANNLPDLSVRAILETSDGALFVGCESGLYKSTDEGKSWNHVVKGDGINSLAAAEGALLMGTYQGLWRSSDAGAHWTKIVLEDAGAYNLKHVTGGILAITEAGRWQDGIRGNRLRLSTDQGKTWQRIDENLQVPAFMTASEFDATNQLSVSDFAQGDKYLFCCTNSGIFRSADLGKNWELVRLSSSNEMFRLVVSGKAVYAVQVVGC